MDSDPRIAALRRWGERIDAIAGAEIAPASADASFRRYFRLRKGNQSFIVMDAPPDREDSRPFIRVAGYLEAIGLNAPRVLEADLEQGFLLLTDLGSTQYLETLSKDTVSADRLYADAISALAKIQAGGRSYQRSLPLYDADFLRAELALFKDWLCDKHLGIRFSGKESVQWDQLCKLLVDNALEQPQVFVHRDYHSRNLMVTEANNPGILDFQDAMEGPLTYDLVSLLKDCYISWSAAQTLDRAGQFYRSLDEAQLQGIDEPRFIRCFELMGVQRHLKAAGIFCRLNHRDGKPGYLLDIPRTLSYIVELLPRYGELSFLVELIEDRCLPQFEAGA